MNGAEVVLVHCWHDNGYVLPVFPPIYSQTCCHCGLRRQSRHEIEAGHGRHAPARLVLLWDEIETPCVREPLDGGT